MIIKNQNMMLYVFSCTQMSSSSEEDIGLHMGHVLTFLSGHLASCQSHSDLRTSNLLYANQI